MTMIPDYLHLVDQDTCCCTVLTNNQPDNEEQGMVVWVSQMLVRARVKY